MKRQVVADTNCSKENSSSTRQKISVRVVKHWIEGGEMTEKLWNALVLEMQNLVLGKALSIFTSEVGPTFKVGSAFSRGPFQGVTLHCNTYYTTVGEFTVLTK